MTLADFAAIMDEIKTDAHLNGVVYDFYPEGAAPALPFAAWRSPSIDPFGADDITFYHANDVEIEMLTEHRDTTKEAAIEADLTKYGIFFSKRVTYLDDEKCYQTLYEMEI